MEEYKSELIKYEYDKLDIKKSRCSYYIHEKKNPDMCQCGLSKTRHHENAIINLKKFGNKMNIDWNPKFCNEEDSLTDAFGQIEFDDNEDSISKYIRCYQYTEMDKISKLLFKTWKLKKPKFIISVTGGAKLKVNPKLRDVFCNGIAKAAYSTKGWITTGGTHTGIMRYVGEAVKKDIRSLDDDHKLVVLGIANWTTVSKRDELIFNENYDHPVQYKLKNYVVPKKTKAQLLDPNHSHFLLVDNSHQNNFGGEILFRARLESYLLNTVRVDEFDTVPVIMVVLDGGPNTAISVIQSINKKIPCMFVNKSGRFSDIFSFIYDSIKKTNRKREQGYKFEPAFRNEIKETIKADYPQVDTELFVDKIERNFYLNSQYLISFKTKLGSYKNLTFEKKLQDDLRGVINQLLPNEDSKKVVIYLEKIFQPNIEKIKTEIDFIKGYEFEKGLQDEVRKMISKEFPNKDKEKILKDIEKIFHPKFEHLLSVFDLNADKNANDMDEAILKGLLKAKKNQYRSMIRLCLIWNRVDFARNFIFTQDLKDQIGSLSSLMEEAIAWNRIDFVELFFENGYSMKKYLTYGNLLHLYNKIPKTSMLYKSLYEQAKVGLTRRERENKSRIYFTYRNIGEITQKLMNNLYKHRFNNDRQFNQIGVDTTKNIIMIKKNRIRRFREKWVERLKSFNEKTLNRKCELPEHELFMFNILLERYDMALIFWREGKNQIASALIASLILKSYLKKYDEDSSKSAELIEKKMKFEELACRTLQLSEKSDQMIAKKMLMTRVNEFSNTTPIQIAIASNSMDFISSPCFQNLTTLIWYNKILPDTPKSLILLSLICPFFAPKIIHFRDKKRMIVGGGNAKKEENQESDSRIHTNKLQYNQKESKLNTNQPLDFFDSEEDLNYWERLISFVRTPMVKFIYNQFWYLVFLLLFSYVILCDFYPTYVDGVQHPNIPEIVLIIIVFSYFIEEIRKVYLLDNKLVRSKLRAYGSEFLNVIQFLALVFFIIGMILRFIPDKSSYTAARVFLSIDFIFWIVKSLVCFTFIRSLGPKITMIGQMTRELAYFLPIILLFMFGYGISSHALRFHNSILNSELLKEIFFPGYFILGGDYYNLDGIMESAEGTCHENFTSIIEYSGNHECQDKRGSQVSLALYVIYLIMMFILLQNVLIAIFSDVYETVDKQADKIWKYQRYLLAYEYFHKPIFVPPFVLIQHFGYLVKFFIKLGQKLCCKNFKPSGNVFKQIFFSFVRFYDPGFYYNPDDAEENRFIKLETYLAKELLFEIKLNLKNEATSRIERTSKKMDLIYRSHLGLTGNHIEIQTKLVSIDTKFKRILAYLNKEDTNISTKIKPKTDILKPPKEKNDLNEKKLVKSGSKQGKENKKKINSPGSSSARSELSINTIKVERLKTPNDFNISEYYPGNNGIKRFIFDKDLRPWSVDFPDYKPIKYTSKEILTDTQADIDQLAYSSGNLKPEISFNCYDYKFSVNRKGIETYEVHDGLPLNPYGRTGIFGRGNLFYWGPNYSVLAIFTRSEGLHTNEKEVIVSVNEETGIMSFPMIFNENLEYNDKDSMSTMLFEVFENEFLNENHSKYNELLKFTEKGDKINEFVDDNDLNTDNSWVECSVVNYHDQLGETLGNVPLKTKNLRWVTVNKKLLSNLDPKCETYLGSDL